MHHGFTLVETLVVMAVIAVLAAFSYSSYVGSREKTYETRAKTEITMLANAIKLYVAKNNEYPPDAPETNLPAAIKEFIAPGDYQDEWPDAPWPGSTYDYDAWDVVKPGNTPGSWVTGQDGINDTWQISIRWCTYEEYLQNPKNCTSRFPKTEWAKDFTINDNAMYWCIKGYCRPNGQWVPWDFPGYCLNCGRADRKGVQAPDGN